MIGLSVSFCVSDIARGVVAVEEVEKIKTPIVSPRWDDIIAKYRDMYWASFPDEAERIIRELLASGRVEQSRDSYKDAYADIAAGHWLVNGEQVKL